MQGRRPRTAARPQRLAVERLTVGQAGCRKYSALSFSCQGGLAKGQRKLNPDVAYANGIACGQSHVGAIRVTPQGKPGPAAVYKSTVRVGEVAIALSNTNGLIAYTQQMTGKSNPSSYQFGVFVMLVDKS